MLDKIIYSTSAQKVFYFLLSHPDEKYYDREVSRLSKVSKASVNFALRDLIKTGLIRREKKGRMYFYYAGLSEPLVRQFKITQNLISVKPLVDKLKNISLKIVLYGSAAKGQNHKDSDIDLFMLTREPEEVKKLLHKSPLKKKLQYVISNPQDFVKLKKKNPVFVKEISSGIVLYEEK